MTAAAQTEGDMCTVSVSLLVVKLHIRLKVTRELHVLKPAERFRTHCLDTSE